MYNGINCRFAVAIDHRQRARADPDIIDILLLKNPKQGLLKASAYVAE